jgi:hypothetical protein
MAVKSFIGLAPGPSFQLCHELATKCSKTAQLRVENSSRTTFRLSPVIYRDTDTFEKRIWARVADKLMEISY